jgi:hypothetical protein
MLSPKADSPAANLVIRLIHSDIEAKERLERGPIRFTRASDFFLSASSLSHRRPASERASDNAELPFEGERLFSGPI